jgi:HAMP domain-containing protein
VAGSRTVVYGFAVALVLALAAAARLTKPTQPTEPEAT